MSNDELNPLAAEATKQFLGFYANPIKEDISLNEDDWFVAAKLAHSSEYFLILKYYIYDLFDCKQLFKYRSEQFKRIRELERNCLKFIENNSIIKHSEITGPILALFKLQVLK